MAQKRSRRTFAIASPYPRVLAFHLVGGENPLQVSREYEYIDIRTWFLELTLNSPSGMWSLRPATAERMGTHGCAWSPPPTTAQACG